MKPFELFLCAIVVLLVLPGAVRAADLEDPAVPLRWSEDIPRLVPESVTIRPATESDPYMRAGFGVNVLEDCWTNDDPVDLELETYHFSPATPITYVWKHKVFDVPCNRYVATIVLTHCRPGKPTIAGNIAGIIPNINLGIVDPGAEWLISVTTAGLGPGIYDWFVVVECNDTNGLIPIGADGDIDDVVGANLGLPPNNPLGPVMHGPEPIEVLDPSPGGLPPGRMAGEEGATRCWCFEVN